MNKNYLQRQTKLGSVYYLFSLHQFNILDRWIPTIFDVFLPLLIMELFIPPCSAS